MLPWQMNPVPPNREDGSSRKVKTFQSFSIKTPMVLDEQSLGFSEYLDLCFKIA